MVELEPGIAEQEVQTASTSQASPLLKLPRELRDQIYSHLLVVPEHERWQHHLIAPHGPLFRRRKIALGSKTYWSEPRLLRHPPLLGVSSQIRAEADEIYWGRNEWQINLEAEQHEQKLLIHVEPDLRTPRLQMKKWVRKMGGIARLRPLRDLTLRLGLTSRELRQGLDQTTEYLELRVMFDGTSQMHMHPPRQLLLPTLRHSGGVPMPLQSDAMGWHLANTHL